MPDQYANIVTYRGAQFSDEFVFSNPDGSPMNLSGFTATANGYKGTPDAPGALALEATTANGRLVITAAAGKVARTLAPAATSGLAAGDYWYELFLIDAGGNKLEPIVGFWQHLPTGAVP